MICFVIYGVNIYVSKLSLIVLKKNVWYSNDFCGFLLKFSMILADFFTTRIRIRFIEADPADQNETDPYGSGFETLLNRVVCPSFVIYKI